MSTPEQAGFRMPAEWHPHERCWMAWPCREETWETVGLLRARTAYAEVAKAIARHEPVSMLVNPEDMTEAARLCGPQINLETLALDDSWTRDTGPSFLLGANQELAGVDWIHNAWGGTYENCERDNQIAANILQKTKARAFKAPLVMEGGSFHVDGQGTILTTRECLLHPNRNPQLKAEEIESYLCQYLGGKKVIWLNEGLIGDETNGHVDEIACFIAPGKVLCLITSDKDDENYDRLQENREILATATDAKGQRLTVHTVEQPKATYLNQERLTLSYINYYLANQGIVMASFGDKARDQAAYALFRGLFPAQVVTQLPALDIFAGGGGIHCITQQQPRSVVAQ